jgi:WD40 repeat protein
MVATGQVGKAPTIFIWGSENAEIKHKIKLPKGTRSVTTLGFSFDGKYLAACDLHNDHNIHVFNLVGKKGPVLVFSEKGGPDKIMNLSWSAKEGDFNFCTVGPKHI